MTVQELADQINAIPPGAALRVSAFDLMRLTGSASGWRRQTITDELLEKVIGSRVGTVETETDAMTGDVTFHKTNI